MTKRHLLILAMMQIASSPGLASMDRVVSARLQCGALSGAETLLPQFAAHILFKISEGKLIAERDTERRKGHEKYEGAVSNDGSVKISAEGRFFDDSASWSISLYGPVRPDKTTFVGGRLTGRDGKTRDCTMQFKLSKTDLRYLLDK